MMDEGPTYSVFPIVYYYRGRVREEMKTTNFADSYREYPQDPRRIKRRPARAGSPQARRELTHLPGRRPGPYPSATAVVHRACLRLVLRRRILRPEIKLRIGRERASSARTDSA